MKTNAIHHYFSARVLQASTIIEVNNIRQFCSYLDANHIKQIFLLNDSACFAVLNQQALLQIPNQGYQTIDDYRNAESNSFPSANLYYEATEAGYTSYEDYQLVIEAGISDREQFNTIKELGFLEGFKELQQLWEEGVFSDLEMPVFKNPYDLYSFADKNKFEDYKSFFEALNAGFLDAGNYEVAKERGFTNAREYQDALCNGFYHYNDYKMAVEANIKTYAELKKKFDLELAYKDLPHDQIILLSLLSKLEQGKRISINKLNSSVENAVDEYKHEDTQEIPGWFKQSFERPVNIAPFLEINAEVKKFGEYDPEGEFFEVKLLKDRSVVIDGSNVAHNSKKGNDEKPLVANMIAVVNYLKSKGFTDILIISDASLSHKLADKEKLEELEKEVTYSIAPAQTSADVFIISYVKSKHCLLVSNDTFREHKVNDAWTAENIDFYRLAFMITDGEVFMPDLKG
jgi:Zc3h12a-like Ribonuclease NYN domain